MTELTRSKLANGENDPFDELKGHTPAASLRANMLHALIGNIVYAGCQWMLVIMLAKRANAAAVGEFALGLAVTAPIVLFANLHLRALQATDAHGRYPPEAYVKLRLRTTALALALIVIIALFGRYSRETAATIVVVGVAKAIEALSDVLYGRMQQQERMAVVALSLVGRGILSLAFGGLLLRVSQTGLAVAFGMAMAWAAVLLVYDLRQSKLRWASSRSVSWATQWELAKSALPLGVVAMLVSLTPNIPRYFLEQQRGTSALGRYAALAYFVVAGTTVANAAAQAASGRLSATLRDNAPAFRRLLDKLTFAAAAMGLLTVLAALVLGPPLLRLLYTNEYAREVPAFAWLMAAGGASYAATFSWYGLMALRQVSVQIPLNLVVVTVTATASAVLVPRLGVEGAAIALFFGTAAQSVLAIHLVRRGLTSWIGKGRE